MIPATWCPEHGPGVHLDEDGACTMCGSQAQGPGAVAALQIGHALRGELTHHQIEATNLINCACVRERHAREAQRVQHVIDAIEEKMRR